MTNILTDHYHTLSITARAVDGSASGSEQDRESGSSLADGTPFTPPQHPVQCKLWLCCHRILQT